VACTLLHLVVNKKVCITHFSTSLRNVAFEEKIILITQFKQYFFVNLITFKT